MYFCKKDGDINERRFINPDLSSIWYISNQNRHVECKIEGR